MANTLNTDNYGFLTWTEEEIQTQPPPSIGKPPHQNNHKLPWWKGIFTARSTTNLSKKECNKILEKESKKALRDRRCQSMVLTSSKSTTELDQSINKSTGSSHSTVDLHNLHGQEVSQLNKEKDCNSNNKKKIKKRKSVLKRVFSYRSSKKSNA